MRIFKALFVVLLASSALPLSPVMAGEIKSAQAAKKAQTICPVEGGQVNRKIFTDYKGKRIYFCCPSCIETFKKDPEKYMTQLEKAGIELENSPVSGPSKVP